jgi:YVTN family beta-propeller protein
MVLWLGAMTTSAAALAAPFAYVPNEQQKLNVIDLATNTIVTRITTESATSGIAVGASVNRAYVADSATGTMQVIDTSTNSTIATLNVCRSPSVPALNPSGTRLVIPCRANPVDQGGLVVLDTSSFNLTSVTTTEANVALWNPQGTRYFVTSNDRVTLYDGATNQPITSIGVPAPAFSMAVNGTSTRLFVASLGTPSGSAPTITNIDLDTGAIVGTMFPSSEPTWIAANPAGNLLYVASAPADMMQVFFTGNNELGGSVSFPPGSRPSSLAVSPDGQRVYIEMAGKGYIQALQTAPPFLPVSSVFYGASGFAWGSFIGAGSPTQAAQAPGYLSGLWWNPSESGWGLQVTKRRNLIVATWFTYDNTGNQVWYISPDCAIGGALSCSGTLYIVRGGKFFGGFDMSRARVEVAGSIQLQFTSVNSGFFGYTVGPQSRGVSIQRQPVATTTTTPPINYTDLWWNPNESGWGMTITHQPGNMFLAWYVYDAFTGEPAWLTSSCATSVNACDGTLYRTTGPPFNQTFDPSRVTVKAVGSVHISFSDPDNAVLSYTVDGVDGMKNITREVF